MRNWFGKLGPTGNRTQAKGFRVPCTHRYTIGPSHYNKSVLSLSDSANSAIIIELLSVLLLIDIH